MHEAKNPPQGRKRVKSSRGRVGDPLLPGLPQTSSPTLAPQEPVAVSNSYLGTDNNKGACQKQYQVVGYAPAGGARHPLFLYFVGTDVVGNAASADDYKAATQEQGMHGACCQGTPLATERNGNTV